MVCQSPEILLRKLSIININKNLAGVNKSATKRMNTITHLTLDTGHKLTKPMNELGMEVYKALPLENLKKGARADIPVKMTDFKIAIELQDKCCFFLVFKNEAWITSNYFSNNLVEVLEYGRKTQSNLITKDKFNSAELPILITAITPLIAGLTEDEIFMLADLEFCVAQIVYEYYFSMI